MRLFPSTNQKAFAVILIFILLNGLLMFSVDYLPFIDLPNHLAEATIYKFHDDPGNILSQYYKPTPLYFPNTFHTVFCSLFPSVEFGNAVFHTLYIVLLTSALFLVVKELNGNLWYGLLGLLFTYNYNVTYGFVGFAISIPGIVFLFYLIVRDLRKDTVALKISISFMLVILFLMHAQNALLGLALYGLLTLYKHHRSFRELAIRAIVIPLPLIALVFAWWFTRTTPQEQSTFDYLIHYYSSEFLSSWHMRFRIIVFDNFQLQEGTAGLILASFLFLLLLIPLVTLKLWEYVRSKKLSEPIIYALIFFVTTLSCYLVLPDKLPGQTPLFQRLCTIVILSFIILASLYIKHERRRWLPFYTIASLSLYCLLWFQYIFEFNAINKSFRPDFFEGLSNKSTLAGLIYDNTYRGRKTYIHFPNYFVVWNHGIAASKIIDYRFGVVRRVASEDALPFYDELIGEGYRYHPEYAKLDYLLVRGDSPVQHDLNLSSFERIRESGPWKLFRRKSH